MLQDYSRYLIELFLPFRIVIVLQPYESLDLKLYRCERILDLMGNLTGHLAPCLVSLSLCKSSCRITQVLDHSVVGLHEGGYLVISTIIDMLQVVEICISHLLSHLYQRSEHRVYQTCTDEQRYYKQQDEEIDDQCGMEESL